MVFLAIRSVMIPNGKAASERVKRRAYRGMGSCGVILGAASKRHSMQECRNHLTLISASKRYKQSFRPGPHKWRLKGDDT